MKLVLVPVALLALDRLALWAEGRGWIYWRRRKRLGTHMGAAVAAELGAILSPAERTRQEIVAQAERLPEEAETADGRPRPPGVGHGRPGGAGPAEPGASSPDA